jgi:hypothetical protein
MKGNYRIMITIGILVWGFILFVVLLGFVSEFLTRKYNDYKLFRQDYIKEKMQFNAIKNKKLEVKRFMENLTNNNNVKIGLCNIKYNNQKLTIERNIININDIKELKLTENIIGVWENVRNMQEYTYDENLGCRVLDPSWGTIKDTRRISVEEYERGIRNPSATYDLDKTYYITIILYNGFKMDYLIGNCYHTKTITNLEICYYMEEAEIFEEMFNELHDFILKEKEKYKK